MKSSRNLNLNRCLVLLVILLALSPAAAAFQSEATKRLLERNKMFEPHIMEVADNVYTAIGYTVSANSFAGTGVTSREDWVRPFWSP